MLKMIYYTISIFNCSTKQINRFIFDFTQICYYRFLLWSFLWWWFYIKKAGVSSRQTSLTSYHYGTIGIFLLHRYHPMVSCSASIILCYHLLCLFQAVLMFGLLRRYQLAYRSHPLILNTLRLQ